MEFPFTISYKKCAQHFTDTLRNHSNERRQRKHLQYIDQSLRTVATQLLNATNPEDTGKVLDNNVIKTANNNQKAVEKNDASPIKESNTVQSMSIGFGRPMNSKFGFFETSHPGQAMAITEEELEREMSSTRLMTAYKNQPTTTGGISTWILLNPPPPTTVKSIEIEKKSKQPLATEVTSRPTTLMERVETTDRVMERVTMPVPTTAAPSEASTTKKLITVTTKMTVESKPQRISDKIESLQNSTAKVSQTTTSNSEGKEAVTTVKRVQTIRTTPKPKTATSKTTLVPKPSNSKVPRPNQPVRTKLSTRRTTVRPDVVRNENGSATGKIEKVTFRPVQMVTKSKSESTEKPMFVTKIKASVLMDNQKATTLPTVSSSTSLDFTTATKGSNLVEMPVKSKPVATKLNNILKAQLKKPVDETTRIEIEPIKVNAPILKIEKVEKEEKQKDDIDNSKMDLQFEFNPELTKVNVDSEASASTTTTTQASTTKRPRQSSKRKKNKSRRRKPSTTTTTIAPVSTSSESELAEAVAENGIQESKIEPETKVASSNSTKTKKKPAQKPISTQIYNFLSREVMPSFGVMSLVGLGLGLASYFLYPFGGTIARRNYEVEPKYKYSFDEYGGNYGQNEEEVLSKVLQGMTTDDNNKYPGGKDYDNNYYRYHHYDGSYESQTTKKNDQRYSSSAPMYRPENTGSVLKHRNTDYRYQDAPSTPNYYERPNKHTEYVVGQSVPGSANRQFVVGSIPKEYPPYDEKVPPLSTPGKLANSYQPTESGQFDEKVGQNFKFPGGSVQNYGQIQTARPEEGYDELEITPTAVAVEHGPRSLKAKRSLPDPGVRSRRKRDSVIQVIPSKKELEEEEKEEDLSNEILNIIDSALPGEDEDGVKRRKQNEVEDFEKQRRKQKEEEKKRLKESTVADASSSSEMPTGESVSSAAKDVIDSSSQTSDTDSASEATTTSSSKITEESTVEWIDLTTTSKPTEENGFNLLNVVKKIAQIKFRLGLSLLKHASEGFARYLGHVQKRINGEE